MYIYIYIYIYIYTLTFVLDCVRRIFLFFLIGPRIQIPLVRY